ncbi:MAG: ROK family glucokinase [Frankiales bacterium]|nr:ROK family glucokinase [Frankiales bacterium]
MSVTIGVDIGGTKIAGGLVDVEGTVLARARRDTPARSADGIVEAIVAVVADLTAAARAASLPEVEAVGLGAAGLVDETRSIVRFAPNVDWKEEPLGPAVRQGCGLPVVVENDANAAAWGEFRFGAGRGAHTLVAVTVGTGIGGGIIHRDQLVRGSYGMAAEFGHVVRVPDGRLCGCGKRGCWEQYASGNALLREARELAAERRTEAGILLALGDGTPEGVTGQHVTVAARDGDPVALEAFARIGAHLGSGLADVAAILDPELFVIGGGVSEAGELLLDPARAAFETALVAHDHRPVARVVPAQLGNDAGLVGAADLARDLTI